MDTAPPTKRSRTHASTIDLDARDLDRLRIRRRELASLVKHRVALLPRQ
jgi:hypothetical protein